MSPFIIATLLSLVFFRLFYGVDFSDESYWVAMASNFANGARPFVDELIIHQTPFVLLSPFLKLWHHFFGSEGVVLYCRMLFLVMNCAVACAVFTMLQRVTSRVYATVVAAVFPLIVPLQIPNLSYNSIGAALFALALFLVIGKRLRLAALSHGFAVIAYPTLLVPSLLHLLLVRKQFSYRERVLALVILIATPLIFLGIFFPFPHFESLTYTLTAWEHGGGIQKLITVFRHFFYDNVPLSLGVIMIVGVGVRKFAPRFAACYSILFFPLLYLCFRHTMYTQMWMVFYGGLLAPLFGTRFLKTLWLPSVIAAITIGWSSMSAPINGVIGMVPALLVTVFGVMKQLESLSPTVQQLGISSIHVLLVLSLFSGKAFYRDGDFRDLFARVTSGPFRGLITTAYKHRYLVEVSRDIKRHENPNGRILFYEFPAGYLISQMKPLSNSLWIRTQSKGSRYYRDAIIDDATPYDRIFVFHWVTHDWDKTYAVNYDSKDSLVQYLRSQYQAIEQTENYTVLVPHSRISPLLGAK